MSENIYVGTAGWSYKDWQGTVYPAKTKRSQHPLEYLAQFFDMVEINTSFYGHIKPEWGTLWSRKAVAVNPRFMFTAKLNRAFTHSPVAVVQSTSAQTINATAEDEALAKAGLDSLMEEERLGALVIQFPISFKNTDENREYLGTLLQRFAAYPNVVEVRHASWNNEGILRYFAEKGVAFCNIDQPHLGKSLRGTEHVTSNIGYVRLHGRNYDQWFQSDNRDDRYNYLYTENELRGWKQRITTLAAKAEKTFVVANNHFRGQAAVNALQLKSMLSGDDKVPIPESLARSYPVLESIAA
ncbi:MAG: hypothetical protein JWO20_2720 [Candidatus Angelobacter sp.]|jgi:uncharacterized protein YecE (DUF72 family)|nr:hypothetical protein [Candidatus Angelobacter sp.]